MTWRFLRAMKARKAGYIMNVASIGAWLPAPHYASYAAGKAYVRNFTEAVAYEEGGSGVTLTCLSPGGTSTEFMAVAGHDIPDWQKKILLTPEDCARFGLKSMLAGRRSVIHGWMNAIGMFTLRFVPRRLMTWIAAQVMAKR